MVKFINNIIAILVLGIIFLPISTWSDDDHRSVREKLSDPCFNVNCEAVENYIVNLQKAIKVGNKKEVANYMAFPLRVNKNIKGKSIYYDIENEMEFIQQYNSIITKDVKKFIFKSEIKNIISNYQGIGIANGTLWLSNDTPPIHAFVINVN